MSTTENGYEKIVHYSCPECGHQWYEPADDCRPGFCSRCGKSFIYTKDKKSKYNVPAFQVGVTFYAVEKSKLKLKETPIETLGLSAGCWNTLMRAGITTVEKAKAAIEKDTLRNIDHLSRAMYAELTEVIHNLDTESLA